MEISISLFALIPIIFEWPTNFLAVFTSKSSWPRWMPSAVEVHLINKDIDLYGLNLSVEPVEKLRSQIKFKNIDQLSNQIKKDRDNALKIFKNYKK